MGDVRFYPSQSDVEQNVASELTEYALVQRKMPYQKLSLGRVTMIEPSIGEQYSDIRKIIGYIAQHAAERPPTGYDCEKTQISVTNFVLGLLAEEDRINVKNHLISNCRDCLDHVVMETRLHRIGRTGKMREN